MRNVAVGLMGALLLGGCSLVVDTDRHQSGRADTGTTDTGTADSQIDSAVETDSGVVDSDVPTDTGFVSPEGCGIAPDPATPLAQPDVCVELAGVLCESRRCCCSTNDMTPEDCQTTLEQSCRDVLQPFVLSPDTGYDRELGGMLRARMQGYIETCDPDLQDLWERDGVFSIFNGADPAIGDFEQCQGTLFTKWLSCGPERSCMRPNPSGPLAPTLCRPLSESGGFCRSVLDCESGLRCDSDTQLCGNQSADGRICDIAADCQSLFCEGTCQPRTRDRVYCQDPFGLLAPPTDMK